MTPTIDSTRHEAIRDVAAILCVGCKANDPADVQGFAGLWHSKVRMWCDALKVRRSFPEAFPDQPPKSERWP